MNLLPFIRRSTRPYIASASCADNSNVCFFFDESSTRMRICLVDELLASRLIDEIMLSEWAKSLKAKDLKRG
jgi:hypothetical protein